MIESNSSYRTATAADMPAIMRVRTSVLENHLSVAQLAERGITEDSVTASFLKDSKGWVAECDGDIVAFTIADRSNQSIFALFVLPGFDRRGMGGRLLDLAAAWLWDNGAERIWLTTGQSTRAAEFYKRKGWTAGGDAPPGSLRYELRRPAVWPV